MVTPVKLYWPVAGTKSKFKRIALTSTSLKFPAASGAVRTAFCADITARPITRSAAVQRIVEIVRNGCFMWFLSLMFHLCAQFPHGLFQLRDALFLGIGTPVERLNTQHGIAESVNRVHYSPRVMHRPRRLVGHRSGV